MPFDNLSLFLTVLLSKCFLNWERLFSLHENQICSVPERPKKKVTAFSKARIKFVLDSINKNLFTNNNRSSTVVERIRL